MNPIFKKLNYSDQAEIFVLNTPESFRGAMDEMTEITSVKTDLAKAKDANFVLAFATKQAELDKLSRQAAKSMQGDGILWFAYPKGTSKKYKSEFNRDTGWDVLGQLGFEGVRQVAIDENWSAVRFRRVEYIKTMRRTEQMAMSKTGKERAKRNAPSNSQR